MYRSHPIHRIRIPQILHKLQTIFTLQVPKTSQTVELTQTHRIPPNPRKHPIRQAIRSSLRIVISLSLCSVLLSSCLNPVQLNERAIVQAVGLDLAENGQIRLTLQVFSPAAEGGGSISATADNAKIIEGTGATVSEAIQNATLFQGKQLFVGHNRMILIGSALAKRGTEQSLSYFASSTGSRQNVHVAVAEGNASDILKAKINQGILPAETLEKIVENSEENGMMKSARLYEFLKTLETSYESSILPIMAVKKEPATNADIRGQSSSAQAGETKATDAELDEISSVHVVGTAVFHGDKMSGTLNREESRGLLWTCGEVEQTILTVSTDKFETAALRVFESQSRLSSTIGEDNRLSFALKVQCEAAIGDCVVRPGQVIGAADLELLARAGEDLIVAESEAVYLKAAIEEHADIFGLGSILWQKSPDLWRQKKDAWQEQLGEAGFQVEAKIELDRAGIEFQQTNRENTASMTESSTQSAE